MRQPNADGYWRQSTSRGNPAGLGNLTCGPSQGSADRQAPALEVALDIVDNEGIDSLSIRRLAERLNVNGASLYHHFENKEEIVVGAAKLALEGVRTPQTHDEPWQVWIMQNTRQLRQALRKHPDLIPIMLRREPLGIGAGELDSTVTLLEQENVPTEAITPMLEALELYAIGSALHETRAENRCHGKDLDPTETPNQAGVPELPMDRYADVLVEQTDQLAVLIDGADLDRRVPTCPEWDLRQLVAHIGQAHRFGADVVRRRVGDFSEVTDLSSFPVTAADIGGWLSAGARELAEAVRSVGAEQRVWNYLGADLRAGFWLRRMANETAVHRADAALTVGAPFELDAELAAEAVSEWLSLINTPGGRAHRPKLAEQLRGHGQTLHLHATDSPSLGQAGEWLIRRGPDAVSWEHTHKGADVVVRARATDLLLALLGRIPLDDERLEVTGDAALFEHWVQHVTF